MIHIPSEPTLTALTPAMILINPGSAVPQSDTNRHAKVLQTLIKRQSEEVSAYLTRNARSPAHNPADGMNWVRFHREIEDLSWKPEGLDSA
jgi:hypothetical protein